MIRDLFCYWPQWIGSMLESNAFDATVENDNGTRDHAIENNQVWERRLGARAVSTLSSGLLSEQPQMKIQLDIRWNASSLTNSDGWLGIHCSKLAYFGGCTYQQETWKLCATSWVTWTNHPWWAAKQSWTLDCQLMRGLGGCHLFRMPSLPSSPLQKC